MKKRAISSLAVVLIVASLTACQTAPDHLDQGIIFANQNDYNNAVTEFKAAIASSPSPDAYANLGASYMQLGKLNLAMVELEKAEAMDPDHTLTLYNLTALHSLNDDSDLALEYLDRALTSGFDNYDSLRFDPDLNNLRGEPEFRSILEKHKVFIQ